MAKRKAKRSVARSASRRASKEVPVGVKIVSVLYYIGATILAIIGIGLLFGDETIMGMLPMAIETVGALVAIGVFYLVLSVIGFFVARGLWKPQSWARIVTIILSVLGFVGGINSIANGDISGGIIAMIVEAIIGSYLMFNTEVKRAFK